MYHQLLLCLILLVGCQLNLQTPNRPPSVEPNVADWQQLDVGLHTRFYQPPQGATAVLQTLRIDPDHYNFRAHYQPEQPLSITGWVQALPDAAIIINANFFTPQYTVLGLLVSDGVAHGASYSGRGGTFAVQAGQAAVYSTSQRPYRGEPLEQAVQAFPMFIADGQQVFVDARQQRITRRTIIGQDRQGYIYLMVTPGLGLGLYDLSNYLTTLDIEWTNAFNLDGGGSSMLYVASNDTLVSALDRVPAVLAVYPRS